MLKYHIMQEIEKEIICNWKYEGDYEIYNMPSYSELKEKEIAFANPDRAKNFYSYYENDRLIGFTNILEEEKEVFIE